MDLRKKLRAFTLIELLVVIAIIAILAAILFPVFAEARRSAKATVTLSNIKQQTTGILLYTGDFDDTMVPTAVLGDPDSPFNLLNTGPYKPWSWLLYSYVKSDMVFMDALTQREGYTTCSSGLRPQDDEEARVYCPQFGYAFSVMAPVRFETGRYRHFPVQVSGINSPSQTVMLTIKAHRRGGRRLDWLTPNSGVWMSNLAQPPICTASGTWPDNPANNSHCITLQRWGVGGFEDTQTRPLNAEEGRYSAGNAFRNRMRAITAFSDGSAKSIQPTALSAGTNWNFNVNAASVRITDRSAYMWDVE